MQSQMTRPYGHDQAEDPIRIHHPGKIHNDNHIKPATNFTKPNRSISCSLPLTEEEEHHEKGATKVLQKVKEKAKRIKNTLTKHGHEHDHDADEEDYEYDEPDPEVHGAPGFISK